MTITRDPDTQAAIDLAREEPESWSARSAAAGWGRSEAAEERNERAVHERDADIGAAEAAVSRSSFIFEMLAEIRDAMAHPEYGDHVWFMNPCDLELLSRQIEGKQTTYGWLGSLGDGREFVLVGRPGQKGRFAKLINDDATKTIADLRGQPSSDLPVGDGKRHPTNSGCKACDAFAWEADNGKAIVIRGPELDAYRALRAAAAQAHAAQQSMAATGQALRDAFQKLCAVIAPGVSGGK